VGHVYLVLNRLRGGGAVSDVPEPLAQAIDEAGLDLIGVLPEEPKMAEFEFTGRPLVELPAATGLYEAVREIAENVLEDGER